MGGCRRDAGGSGPERTRDSSPGWPGAARAARPQPTSASGHSQTTIVRIPSPAAIGRSKKPSKRPSALIIEVMKFSSSIVAEHDAEDRRRDREAVLLHEVRRARPNTSMTPTLEQTELLIANAPTMQNSRMIGISTLRGTRRMLLAPP